MTSIIFKTGIHSSLDMHADDSVTISNVFLPTKMCFRVEFHTQRLKLSLLFCVFSPKHLSNRSSDYNFPYIGFKIFAVSSSNAGVCVKVLFWFWVLSFRYSHHKVGLSGQYKCCGFLSRGQAVERCPYSFLHFFNRIRVSQNCLSIIRAQLYH